MNSLDAIWNYEGDKENGFPHGFGKKIYNGLDASYIGHWVKGRKSGKGKFQYRDKIFEITFKNGKPKTIHSFYDKELILVVDLFEYIEIDGFYIEKLYISEGVYVAFESKFSSELTQKLYFFKHEELKTVTSKGNINHGFSINCQNGLGIYQTIDYEYRGYFLNGMFHGKGTYVTNKNLFKGQFENGKLIGYAKEYDYEQGIIFKGNYKGFEKNGKFKVIIGNYKLKTTFCNNTPNESGKIYINNSILYDGLIDTKRFTPKTITENTLKIVNDFSIHHIESAAKLISKLTSLIVSNRQLYNRKILKNRFKFPRAGSWIDFESDKIRRSLENKENEEKKTISFNGESFKGITRDDGTCFGVYKYTKTEWYYGELKSWKKHGTGRMFANGSKVYNGKWEDDKFHGKGTLFYNGMKISGIWNKGKLEHGCKVILMNI